MDQLKVYKLCFKYVIQYLIYGSIFLFASILSFKSNSNDLQTLHHPILYISFGIFALIMFILCVKGIFKLTNELTNHS